jgi:abequosyltransferase
MSILLSICIPTFNRAKYIEQTLKSIIPKINKNIEIVIYDGASSDNTDEIIQQYTIKYKNIIFYKALKNGGVDGDYANCIEMARGKYCWLMSSDDIIFNNTLDKIISNLKSEADIYLFNRTEADLNMEAQSRQFWLKPNIGNKLFKIHTKDDLMNYFGLVNMVGGIFSYAPSIIVKKTKWQNSHVAEDFYGTCYAHVHRLVKIMLSGCKLQYIQDSLILCRMDNDSFSKNGLVSRYKLDYGGYIKISKALFPNDDILRKFFLKGLRNQHGLLSLIKIRCFINNEKDLRIFKSYYIDVGYSELIMGIKIGKYNYDNLV